jgi:hypothetical protein
MPDWTVIAAAGLGLMLILGWIGTEEARRGWKRARRRQQCRHQDPCLEGTYRGSERGWAREVYYCPDCKHLWAQRVQVSDAEWERLSEQGPAKVQ